jgi:hypothetical protein
MKRQGVAAAKRFRGQHATGSEAFASHPAEAANRHARKLRAKASIGDGKMAIRKDPRDEATGAEKSPSRVGRFVLITLAGAVIALLGVLLYLYNHPLGLR